MIKMAATLSLLINIVMPTITQCIISSAQFIISLAIDVVLSLVYQGITLLGCGGVGVGGGTLGALGGGTIMTFIVGTIMSWIAVGTGAIGGVIVDTINFFINLIMTAYGSAVGFTEGLW